MKIWEIIGYVAVAVVAAGVLLNMHDIKRYLRIRSM